VTDIVYHLAQLRHAYAKLKAGEVIRQAQFADGLIAPAIRALEELVDQRHDHRGMERWAEYDPKPSFLSRVLRRKI
jgi:hypothetical protein